jgi:hypothetical protein
MKTRIEQLISKGKREPLDGLIEEGNAHIGLAEKYPAELATSGWSPADTASLVAAVKSIDTDLAHKTDAHSGADAATLAEHAAVSKAKAFIRHLRLTLPRVLRDRTDLTMDSFSPPEPLQRAAPKLVAYLKGIRTHVATLDKDLSSSFGGKSPLAELDAVHDALVTIGATQDVAMATSPATTATLHETKGRVLEKIEDLNRAGKAAFDGNAVMASIWNKDLLLRARAHAAAGTGAPAPAGPTPGTGGTPATKV